VSWINAITLLVFAGALAILGIATVLLVETLMGPDIEDDE